MNPIIILGSGLAGYNVAKELRKLDRDVPLTVITADSGSFYSKPMLSNALAGKKPPSAIALNTPEQMATMLRQEYDRWGRIVKLAKIEPQ